jgi:hypothetical protein
MFYYTTLLTNTQEAPTHSTAPSKCIHSSNPKRQKDETGKTSQKYRHHRQELYSNPCSSVGTRMPARNPVPLDFASIPRHARYMKKFPLHSPMLSSRKAPATKDARLNPPGLAASSPSACRSFIGGSLSAHNSPRRRAQRGSRLARLVHTWLASVGHAERQLPQP